MPIKRININISYKNRLETIVIKDTDDVYVVIPMPDFYVIDRKHKWKRLR